MPFVLFCTLQYQELLNGAFGQNSYRGDQSRGHMIATLKIYPPDATGGRLARIDSCWDRCTLVQFVDLASTDPAMEGGDFAPEDAVVQSMDPTDRLRKRRAALVRKSLSGLRGVLRGLIVHDAQQTRQAFSYRECTLTQLLQRALDSKSSRAVVIATVCPRKESYQRTLQTLNYVNRLLMKPGDTAQTPFGKSGVGTACMDIIGGSTGGEASSDPRVLFPSELTSAPGVVLSRLAADSEKKALLKNMLSDPRQRVASLLASGKPGSQGDERFCRFGGAEAQVVPLSVAAPAAGKPEFSFPVACSGGGGVRGTFDNVLEKLDALERTPVKVAPPDSSMYPFSAQRLHSLQQELDKIQKEKFSADDENTLLRERLKQSIPSDREKALVDELKSLRSSSNISVSEMTRLRQQMVELEQEKEVAHVQKTVSDASAMEWKCEFEKLKGCLRRSEEQCRQPCEASSSPLTLN